MMAGIGEKCRLSKNLYKSRMLSNEQSIQQIISTVDSMVYPFSYASDDLVSISSGFVASPGVKDDLLTAGNKDEEAVKR